MTRQSQAKPTQLKQTIVGNGAATNPDTEASTDMLMRQMGFKQGSTAAKIVKLVARVLCYAVGIVGTLYAVSMLSMAMVAGGWPMFLIMVLELCAMILGCIASWTVSDKIVDYLAEGELTKDIRRGINWITSLFSSDEPAAPKAA